MHGRRKEEEAEMGIARATHLAQPVGRKGLAAAACGLALAGRAGNRRGEDYGAKPTRARSTPPRGRGAPAPVPCLSELVRQPQSSAS